MITKEVKAKNAACNAVVDLVDQGSFLSAGRLTLYGSDGSSIATLPLSYPAFMDSTDGTAQTWPIYDATATRDATATSFWISDRDGTRVYGGSVSNMSGSGDLKLNSNVLFHDSTVVISSGFFVVP
jgi:hypothetical protein